MARFIGRGGFVFIRPGVGADQDQFRFEHHQREHDAVWVARDRGLFKKHGLDMQYVVMPRSPLAIAALVAGEIDAAIIGPGHLINSASTGSDLSASPIFFRNSITG